MRNVQPELENAAFVQARLLDRFIQLAAETRDGQAGFTRDSLADLIENLREQRRTVGMLVRPRLAGPGPGLA